MTRVSAGRGPTAGQSGAGVDLGFRLALWRGLDLVRIVAAGYALVAFVTRPQPYLHPGAGWVVLVALLCWSVTIALLPDRPAWLVVTDLLLAVGAVLATRVIDTPQLASQTNTLPLIWPGAAVMSWAVWKGPWAGVAAGLAVGVADLAVVDPITRRTLHNLVLLVMAGGIVGYAAHLYERTRRDIAAALETAAAARERERLARDIHDSVLQVLAFVQRRGAEIGGEAGELGRLAGEQEARLRALVAARPTPTAAGSPATTDGQVDVLAAVRDLAPAAAQVSGPADPVMVAGPVADALLGAVGACLANVQRHAGAGARTWVLVEDEPDLVTVTVRDDGVGFDADRLTQAQAEGRLGVSLSVRGRIAEVGGQVEVWSAPGQGSEFELRVPRGASAG